MVNLILMILLNLVVGGCIGLTGIAGFLLPMFYTGFLDMPSSASLALSFAALTVLLVVGCVYYAAFLRQLVRSFGRFQHNALASVSGEAALISLALFAACFVLSYVVCALSAGSLQFWHAWGWFQN